MLVITVLTVRCVKMMIDGVGLSLQHNLSHCVASRTGFSGQARASICPFEALTVPPKSIKEHQ